MVEKTDHQPQKVGAYERPVKRASSSTAVLVGVLVLLIVLILVAAYAYIIA